MGIEGVSDGVLLSTIAVIVLMSATIFYVFEYLPANLAASSRRRQIPQQQHHQQQQQQQHYQQQQQQQQQYQNQYQNRESNYQQRRNNGEFNVFPGIPAELSQLSLDEWFELAATPAGIVLLSASLISIMWIACIIDDVFYFGRWFDSRAKLLLTVLTGAVLFAETRIFTIRHRRSD